MQKEEAGTMKMIPASSLKGNKGGNR